MNYAELVTMIQDEVENEESSFVSHIPDFVRAAEHAIYNAFDLPVERTNSTGLLTANNPYLTLPSDHIDTYSFAVINGSNQTFLLEKDVEFIRESFSNASTTGVPEYFAEFDNDSFILGPTPGSNYTVVLHYFRYPTSIVTAGTTWLGSYYPEALQWGSVIEAYTYMKGEKDIMDMYKANFTAATASLPKIAGGTRNSYRRRLVA